MRDTSFDRGVGETPHTTSLRSRHVAVLSRRARVDVVRRVQQARVPVVPSLGKLAVPFSPVTFKQG